MSGYAHIHRSLLGHPAFRNDSEAMAFAWLIVRAAWRPCRVRYKGHSILLQRGQLAISQRDMAAALDRDKGWIERLWRRLKDEAMITVEAKAGVAVINICNYAVFQADGANAKAADEAQAEAVKKADARQRQGTEQEEEESKNLLSGLEPEPKTRKSRLPESFDPEPFGEGSESAKIEAAWDADERKRQLEAFKAFHTSHGSRFVDWQKAWSTWIINSVKFSKPRQPQAAPGSGYLAHVVSHVIPELEKEEDR